MSYKRFKKQAKKLHKILPEFMAQHPDGGKLSHVQELLIRADGYASMHAYHAAMRKEEAAAAAAAAAENDAGEDHATD